MTTDDRLVSGASSAPNKSSGDIGERLREHTRVITTGNGKLEPSWILIEEAAAEIERRDRLISAHQQQIMDGSAMLAAKDAEIERLRREVRDANRHWNERCVELSVNAHGWMKAHDQLLGFIQSRPELLKVMMTEKPEIKYPSPADVPELVQRALTAESAVAAAWDCIEKLEGGHQLLLAAVKAGDPLNEIVWRIEEELRVIARASALRAAVSKKTAESGHSPSTHNSESE